MPRNRNTSTRKGEGAVCHFAGDTSVYTITEVRIQHLGARFGLSFSRAAIIASLAFGEGAHV